jgi:HEAT repeat protein
MQKECLGILGMYGNGSDALLIGPFTGSDYSTHIRSHAVITLSKMKHRIGIPFLVSALADKEPAIRKEALNGLKQAHPLFSVFSSEKMLSKEAIEKLQKEYENLDPDTLNWPAFPGEMKQEQN